MACITEHPQAFSARSLALISVSFFLLMVVSFGAAFPGGIFMPTIVVGCTFGALFGRFAKYFSCMLDQVRKKRFAWSHLGVKMISLQRQARDKHRKS
eukprot:COSAG06_NODE_5790_length_3273_cov_45.704066_4_plen_97_part_00